MSNPGLLILAFVLYSLSEALRSRLTTKLESLDVMSSSLLRERSDTSAIKPPCRRVAIQQILSQQLKRVPLRVVRNIRTASAAPLRPVASAAHPAPGHVEILNCRAPSEEPTSRHSVPQLSPQRNLSGPISNCLTR